METTAMLLVGLAFVLIVLIRYIVRQNQKDQKEYETFLNNDYPKPKDHDLNDKEDSY
ncbi:hypothetical protein [Flavobacterium sp.]|uniref:hypothetical protein n=1 Tax=Flavobacterium sp. TaxID=239 RepID=UPI0028BEBC2D|nr:hypothetical protein [Flavobacterium sp.]